MQINICENRGKYATLRSSAVCLVVLPAFHVACFQELSYQIYKLAVLNLFRKQIQQNRMVNVVKASLNVTFNKPFCTTERATDFFQRRMTASIWPESVRMGTENRLIDCFKYLPYRILYQLVSEWWNAQRTHFAVALRNVNSFYCFGFIGQVFQFINNLIHIFLSKTISRIIIHTLSSCALVCIKVLICGHVNIFSQKIPIEPRVDTVWMLFRISVHSF